MITATEVFNFFPDASGKFTINYAFTTGIHTTERGKENRIAHTLLPYRRISATFIVNNEEQERLYNFIIKNVKIPVYVPIFSERLYPLNILNMNDVVEAHIDFNATNLFNIKNTIDTESNLNTYLLIGIDINNNNKFYTMTPNLVNDIVSVYSVGTARADGVTYNNFMVFPAIPCYIVLDSTTLTNITSRVISFELNFTEAL